MQVTIPSPPVTEYTFTTSELVIETSIGKIKLYDNGHGKLYLTQTTKCEEEEKLMIDVSSAIYNTITLTTNKKIKR